MAFLKDDKFGYHGVWIYPLIYIFLFLMYAWRPFQLAYEYYLTVRHKNHMRKIYKIPEIKDIAILAGIHKMLHSSIISTVAENMPDTEWIKNGDMELRYSLLPRRCHVSGKSIWLRQAYCHKIRYMENVRFGRPKERWYSPTEYTILLLKK